MAFVLGASWIPHSRRTCRRNHISKCHPRPDEIPSATTSLPSDFRTLQDQARGALRRAISDGVLLLELQFPPVANMATAALNQLLDANRAFVRELVRDYAAQYGPNLCVVFPDASEAKLARKAWGETIFRISWIEQGADSNLDQLIFCVNPGFNISEWIGLETLDIGVPLVTINADFDKVRGGYYPRLFYPGLHKAKDRFLHRFQPIYYLKPFSHGGCLFRVYPEPWQTLIRSTDDGSLRCLALDHERPTLQEVEQRLRNASVEDYRRRHAP